MFSYILLGLLSNENQFKEQINGLVKNDIFLYVHQLQRYESHKRIVNKLKEHMKKGIEIILCFIKKNDIVFVYHNEKYKLQFKCVDESSRYHNSKELKFKKENELKRKIRMYGSIYPDLKKHK